MPRNPKKQSVRPPHKAASSCDPEHIKVFANADAAEKWFEENDPEGVAFEV